MNKDHLLGGITAYFGIDQIAIVLQAWQHTDAKVASAEAAILVGLVAALAQLVRAWLATRPGRGVITPPAAAGLLLALVAGSMLALTACSPMQVAQVQAGQAKAQAAIAAVCTDVNAAAALAAPFSAVPQVAAVETYAVASCGTADAVAALATKAVNDPGTVAWAQDLANQLKAAANPAP